jgi:hypothetical protein
MGSLLTKTGLEKFIITMVIVWFNYLTEYVKFNKDGDTDSESLC